MTRANRTARTAHTTGGVKSDASTTGGWLGLPARARLTTYASGNVAAAAKETTIMVRGRAGTSMGKRTMTTQIHEMRFNGPVDVSIFRSSMREREKQIRIS